MLSHHGSDDLSEEITEHFYGDVSLQGVSSDSRAVAQRVEGGVSGKLESHARIEAEKARKSVGACSAK